MGEYLALPDGAGSFPQDFSGPVVLREPRWIQLSYAYRTFTFFGTAFQSVSTSTRGLVLRALQPWRSRNHASLGFSPFARHY